jgi:hypothetical protein
VDGADAVEELSLDIGGSSAHSIRQAARCPEGHLERAGRRALSECVVMRSGQRDRHQRLSAQSGHGTA